MEEQAPTVTVLYVAGSLSALNSTRLLLLYLHVLGTLHEITGIYNRSTCTCTCMCRLYRYESFYFIHFLALASGFWRHLQFRHLKHQTFSTKALVAMMRLRHYR